MNNRGKTLSHLELLKNRLIFLSTRLGSDAADRSKVRSVVNEAWKSAYHYLGRNQKNPLNDDSFLMLHSTLYVGEMLYDERHRDASMSKLRRLLRDDEYKSYLLDELFTSRNIPRIGADEVYNPADDGSSKRPDYILSSDYIYQYAHDIKATMQTFFRMRNPADSDLADELRVSLAQINRLGWYDTESLGLAVLLDSKGSDAVKLFAQLERYLFLRMFLAYHPTYDNLEMAGFAIQLRKKLISIRDISQAIESHIERYLSLFTTTEVVSESIRHRGYYMWRGIRYLLFEYEQELKRKARAKRDKILWDDFVGEHFESDYETIEHVYPQRPRNDYWKQHFGSFTDSQVTPAF